MPDMKKAFKLFLDESQDLLQDMEDKLINIGNTDDLDDSISSIFRAAHTIKGTAGLFVLDPIVEFTHVVENVLDRIRSYEIPLDEDLINLMLKCKDHMGKLIDSIEDGKVAMDNEEQNKGEALKQELLSYLESERDSAAAEPAVQTTEAQAAPSGSKCITNDHWHISVQFGSDVLRNGMDPLSFLRYLGTIGTIEHIITLFDGLPEAENMDAETCYLAYEINFRSDADKTTIENVFEFVRADCTLRIIPPNASIEDLIELIEIRPKDARKIGEILVACGTLKQQELEEILVLRKQLVEPQKSIPGFDEKIVNDRLAGPEKIQAGLTMPAAPKKDKEKQKQSVRVDAEKLDHLINLIGELVIASAGMEAEIKKSAARHLKEASLTLNHLVEEVRDGALNLRMVQIGDTFNRFHRVVRDVSKELGKTIELQISGKETELDKSVIEKISDPLTHLVRNAIDHGIEAPALRLERDKPATGTVHLNAYHESGSIVVEVSDDGGGLNRDRIFEKAIEKGLVSADAELSDQEVYELIFAPGFSTAGQISNISGRGVGMDVVQSNIQALRGTVEIESEFLQGTVIRIRLPLTLAIIDGFMIGVGDSSYVVPLDIIEECIELKQSCTSASEDKNYINLRGEVLPFVRLREHFQQTGDSGKRENIVVVKYGNHKAGFVVDRLIGEFQTVIKPLGSMFKHLKGISGSTILGSGEVALILDAPALIQKAINQDALVN